MNWNEIAALVTSIANIVVIITMVLERQRASIERRRLREVVALLQRILVAQKIVKTLPEAQALYRLYP